MDWTLILRLVVAGALGGLVGLERELRAKEAGLRTHFIVALGSALFMIISQYAFGSAQHDAARVAAQVVSGIGFIGAGVIIFQRNAVRGVTTAAGLWVVAAIGLACGAGMWDVAVAASVLTVLCLEAVHFVHKRYGEKTIGLSADCKEEGELKAILQRIKDAGIDVESWSLMKGRASFELHIRQKDYINLLPAILSSLNNPNVEILG
ncbi:MAG: MgtC/SapB family protein [Bacteroidales bacterium]|nr:MgtC/SapB family protein [Bacteroidales bacterium]